MTSPSNSDVQNLLPVQAYFNLDGSFNTFIGQGVPFYATANPSQSGLNITNSTINSTTIGATTPSTGVFTNIATTTGTITTAASGPNDIVNKQYVDYFAAGLSWKAPALTATSANITLSGLQTINGVTLVAGNTVLVKDQTNAAQNGIYVASAGAWTYSVGGDTWNEYIGAIIFIASGSLNGTAWYCTAQPGGTLGVTAMNWSNFSVASTYTAGTGLTLTGTQFSITNTGVSAATYGSTTTSAVIAVNAQGQITSASNSTITPAVGSITGLGTGVATALAVNTGSAGAFVVNGGALGTPSSGTLTNCTFPTLNQSTTGNAATATNLLGGAAGSLPYQTATNTTGFLAAGSNGQVLTLASGIPSWATPTTGTVTSIATAGTVNGLTLTGGPITGTGTITLGGTLDLSAPPTIGNTTPNTGAFTTLTSTNDATINGLIVGHGGGNVSNNTVLGVTALDSNTTGQQNVAVGINALTTATTANNQTAVGYQALRLSTASDNTAVGSTALQTNSSGAGNVAVGFQTLTANTTGGSNTAIGRHALITNSTGSNITALGNHAGAYETGSNALYIDAYDRTNTAGDKAGALLYGTFNATPSSQTLTINGQVTLPYQTNFNAPIALTGSTGTSGYLMASNGASTPSWVAQSTITAGSATNATNIAITDDTTTNATMYPVWVTTTTGNLPAKTASTKLSFNPSTGVLSSTTFSGSGTSLTGVGLLATASTYTALQTFVGTSSNADLKTSNILEVATISATAATGTIQFDVTTQSVLYYTTNASGNFTLNFRGSTGTSLNTIMSTGESLSVTFLVTNGSTAYYNSAVTIDGNSVTPKWQGGSAPTSGNASSIDSYTYVIFKTGSATFTVLASVTKFA
jgi:hypothetical protein